MPAHLLREGSRRACQARSPDVAASIGPAGAAAAASSAAGTAAAAATAVGADGGAAAAASRLPAPTAPVDRRVQEIGCKHLPYPHTYGKQELRHACLLPRAPSFVGILLTIQSSWESLYAIEV